MMTSVHRNKRSFLRFIHNKNCIVTLTKQSIIFHLPSSLNNIDNIYTDLYNGLINY